MKHLLARLIFLVVLLFLGGCATFRTAVEVVRPDFKFKGVEFVGINASELTLNFKIEMENKMAIPIGLEGIDYDIRVEGVSLFRNATTYPMRLPASGVGEIKIPVSLNYKALRGAWATLKGKKEFNYDLAAGMLLDVPIAGERRLPFKKAGTLPMVLPPKLAVTGLKLKGLDWPKAELGLEVQVDNPNEFDWVVKGLSYALTVNGNPWAELTRTEPLALKKQSISSVVLPFHMDFSKLGQGAFQQMLANPNDVTYGLTGRVDLNSPLPELPEISIPLNKTGNMSLINSLAPGSNPLIPNFNPNPPGLPGLTPGIAPGISPPGILP